MIRLSIKKRIYCVVGLTSLFLTTAVIYLTNQAFPNQTDPPIVTSTLLFPTSDIIIRAESKHLTALYSDLPEKMSHPKKRIKTLRPFDYEVSASERQTFYKLLRYFDWIMQMNGLVYFMSSGTLLGSVRFHDMLPWDDDADVFVPVTSRDTMRQIFRRASRDNASHAFILKETGSHDKLYLSNETWIKPNDYSWGWPYLDISFYNQNTTHITDIAKTYGQHDTYPIAVIFPLTRRPFHDLMLPSPHDSFAYCVWSYGYTSRAVINTYSHMVEGAGVHYANSDLHELIVKRHWPHVKRSASINQQNCIIEELIGPEPANKIIQRLCLNEPLYSANMHEFQFKLNQSIKQRSFNYSIKSISSSSSNSFSIDIPSYLPLSNHSGVF